MTENKRRYSRYTVEGTGVNANATFSTAVEILDISVGGASISCTRRMSIGADYLFRFEHKGRVISVKGEVVWAKLTGCRKISDGEAVPVYTFGIQFKDVGDMAKSIEDFMAEESGEVRERRLGRIRVKIHAPERATATYTANNTVAEIGLGGMRLLMDDSPPEGTNLTMEIFISESERAIECGGRVAFSNAISGGVPDNRHSVGIEFTYLSDEDKERIERFIGALPPA